MATFYFSNDRVVDLDFCEKYHKQIELNVDLVKRLKAAGEYISSKDIEIKENKDPSVLDTMSDYVMDAIDMILGDGESDKILELKPGYSVLDALEVFEYISDEINKVIDKLKNTYEKNTAPSTMNPPMNRAQRRAAARNSQEIVIPPHTHDFLHP